MQTVDTSTAASEPFYKGYWLVTSRCNLDCDYCVLEDAPHQLRRELDLDGKMALVAHLYSRLGFRGLTFSGGEVLLIGRRAPSDFLRFVEFLRTFRSPDPRRNLAISVYTNGVLLDDVVADTLVGVVDRIALTIDSDDDGLLTQIGRNTGRHRSYFERTVDVCRRLTQRGISVELHSVVGVLNHARIGDEVRAIYDAVVARGGAVARWKFYQYMSYDDPARDGRHAVEPAAFARTVESIRRALEGTGTRLHFKDNGEMHDSLFNILPYGCAQYMRVGDTWSTTARTRDLREYGSMRELLASHDIDQVAFNRYHQLRDIGGGAK